MDVTCTNPQIVQNPCNKEFVLLYDTLVFYIIKDHSFRHINISASDRKRIYFDGESLYKVFGLPYQVLDGSDDSLIALNSCQFINISDGDCQPFYLMVPCGHCDVCNSKRDSSINQRCVFQSFECDYCPLFVTLTYNEQHLPVDGVSKRHIQLFKKRFQRFVWRHYKRRLKFCVTSEYGKLGRPHYHMIIFGLPCFLTEVELELLQFSPSSESAVRLHEKEILSRLISYFWRENDYLTYNQYLDRDYEWYDIGHTDKPVDDLSFGFVNVEVIQSGNVAGYVTKYVNKGSNVPDGCNKNFILMSTNMGVEFVHGKLEEVFEDPDHKLSYMDSSGEVSNVCLSSYYIDKFLPSVSKQLFSEFKRVIFQLQYHVRQLLYNLPYIDFGDHVRRVHLDREYKDYLSGILKMVHDKFPTYEIFNVELDQVNPRIFDYDFPYIKETECIKNYGQPFIDYALAVIDSFPDFISAVACDQRRHMLYNSYFRVPADLAVMAQKHRENKSKLADKAFLL